MVHGPSERPGNGRPGNQEEHDRAVQKRLDLIASTNQAFRSFAATMRATSAERRRFAQERERSRLEVESERARLEAILRQMPGGVFIVNRSGQIVLANERATRIYGKRIRSAEECVRHALSYPDGEEVLAERYPLYRSLRGEHVSGEELYALRGDGTRAVVSVNSAPVRDEEGRIVAAVKAFQDITRHKEAEEALKESERRLRAVVEGTPVVLFSLNREGVYTLMEGQGLKALGLEPGELLGRSVFDVFGDEPEVVATVRRALAGEAFVEKINGRGRAFEIWYTPLRDEGGGVTGVIGVATDITEREEAARERDQLLAREWMARAETEERKRISRELHDRVAHSMAVVHQSLELHEALKEHDPGQAAARMEIARKMAKEALDATRNLSQELRNTEVEDGLSVALSNLLKTTLPPNIRWTLSVGGEETSLPPGVREQLFLILREAVRNTVSHSGAGRLRVGVDVETEMVVGSVEDDGEGFDPGRNGAPGTGLRSMVERAELLGGSIAMNSATDSGTRIEVSIPFETAEPSDGRR